MYPVGQHLEAQCIQGFGFYDHGTLLTTWSNFKVNLALSRVWTRWPLADPSTLNYFYCSTTDIKKYLSAREIVYFPEYIRMPTISETTSPFLFHNDLCIKGTHFLLISRRNWSLKIVSAAQRYWYEMKHRVASWYESIFDMLSQQKFSIFALRPLYLSIICLMSLRKHSAPISTYLQHDHPC